MFDFSLTLPFLAIFTIMEEEPYTFQVRLHSQVKEHILKEGLNIFIVEMVAIIACKEKEAIIINKQVIIIMVINRLVIIIA